MLHAFSLSCQAASPSPLRDASVSERSGAAGARGRCRKVRTGGGDYFNESMANPSSKEPSSAQRRLTPAALSG
jgi:hypothetical protein